MRLLGIEQPVLPEDDVRAAALAAAGFTVAKPGVRETWSWRIDHTPASWLELLSSMTDYRSLAGGARDALFAQLCADLSRLADAFEVTMVTSAIVASIGRTS